MNRISQVAEQLLGEQNRFKRVPKWTWLLIAILASWAMLHLVALSDSWNVRVTVVIDTPEGEKTGSSIWRIHHYTEPSFFPAQGGSFYKVDKGEAVVIDLGRRGKVFALLRGADSDIDYSHRVVLKVFPQRGRTPVGTMVLLDRSEYPMLVRFKNENDPKTVENVYGTEIVEKDGNPPPQGETIPQFLTKIHPALIDHVESDLGAGVRIKSVSLEIVEDPVSMRLKDILPWLSRTRGTLGGEDYTGVRIYQRLDVGDFQRGA